VDSCFIVLLWHPVYWVIPLFDVALSIMLLRIMQFRENANLMPFRSITESSKIMSPEFMAKIPKAFEPLCRNSCNLQAKCSRHPGCPALDCLIAIIINRFPIYCAVLQLYLEVLLSDPAREISGFAKVTFSDLIFRDQLSHRETLIAVMLWKIISDESKSHKSLPSSWQFSTMQPFTSNRLISPT
jgi:hypothetical protein